MKTFFHEFFIFGIKQLLACKFAVAFFLVLLLSHLVTFGLHRYDFLFLGMVSAQIFFVATKIESLDELKVICLFHLIGVIFELFKTHPAIGSWAYPEPGYFKIATVPLYSGFMYAAVASYVIQSWRILNVKLNNYPPGCITVPFGILIYAHFFLKYVGIDLKWFLVLTVFIIYWKTQVIITTTRQRKLPLSVGFMLVGFFLWIAENISTFLGAWQYPHQQTGWNFVKDSKIGAWFLLYIVSFVVVTHLKLFKEKKLPQGLP